MSKKFLSLICVLSLIFSGCAASKSTVPAATTAPTIPIAVNEQIAPAVVGTAYDLSTLIAPQDGITYQYSATYQDPASGQVKELNVRKNKITPKAETDISVTITATQGEISSSIQLVVPVKITADIMDTLLAAQETENVTKSITKDTAYVHSENSTSALEVSFQGTAQLLNLADHVLHPYYSAQVWNNAAVSFWVYTKQDMTFKLSSHNPQTGKTLSWDSPENTQVQTAKAGTWTHVVFSLYDMGITQPLTDAFTYQRDDVLQVWASCSSTEKCTLYIDKLDIVSAETLEGLTTGYVKPAVPSGNFSNLLSTCKVYTNDSIAVLEKADQGTYRFGCNMPAGYPVFYADFPKVTDISGFDYLKFDVMAENAYPHLTVAVRYLDQDGNVQIKGTSYDYYANQWQTIYVNLDYLHGADLTKVLGISFSVHMDKNFVSGQFNTVSFRNAALYTFPEDEPQMSPAIMEDNDLISGTFYTTSTKPNTSGVCKVAADETGASKSNSMLLFWTNNACGYPVVDATFMFETPQDWTDKSVLSFDTHQDHGHYWLQLTILYLDENGKEKSAVWYFDTLITTWKTNHASFEWFKAEDGSTLKPEMLDRVVGIRVAPNMAINVTAEVAQIYFDNFVLS